jgi:hypothetical protein
MMMDEPLLMDDNKFDFSRDDNDLNFNSINSLSPENMEMKYNMEVLSKEMRSIINKFQERIPTKWNFIKMIFRQISILILIFVLILLIISYASMNPRPISIIFEICFLVLWLFISIIILYRRKINIVKKKFILQ